MHIHVLGICGTFMGGIAAIAREAGHRVTGCDANVYPPMSDQLRALGIELIDGYDPAQLALEPDLWVIGNVVSRGNPLMEAILDARLPYVSGPQWLAEQVLRGRPVAAVAGTHGKTTTASMLAFVLEQAGLEPGFLIGGVPVDFPVSARLGRGEWFVIEADEYDTAFFDKRSKFVHYRPQVAVLNNLEFDHADIFPDLAAIETQFHHLVRTVPRSGWIVPNASSEAIGRVLARGVWSACEVFGSATGWHERDVIEGAGVTTFDIYRGDHRIGRCELALAGAHNRANALAVVAAAERIGVAPPEAIAALGRFGGVRRRLELRGERAGVRVYDDFAHHPTAIETTVAGLRARIGNGERILAVLEPRSNTMKLGTMAARLPASLAQADLVFCQAAGLGWDAGKALAPLGDKARVLDDLDALVGAILAQARAGDHLLVMSNGSFGGIHERLLARLGERRCAGRLIYLHGFRSSPNSFKAKLLAARMAELGRAADFVCPQLPPSPAEAIALVEREIAPQPGDTLVGSSLGGYYATWLAERYGCRAVLLNPAVDPAEGLRAHVGPQTMYHSDDPFVFEARYLDELAALRAGPIGSPQRVLLVAAKGDELLDWRDMVGRYPGARQIVLEGSDHGLSDFAELIDEVLRFAGALPEG
jgi:UDP-N-acetylmuramate: L-alanyl-gamma-D-glutamyl-meso-diaminopimelate ligase